jgi:predicted ATP-binding protein involved in virulence
MTVNTHLRIDKLKLRNFRCFEELEIDLHPELTVLVAENGQGKTAILDAIAIALGLFVDTITDKKQSPGFERSDIRLVRTESGAMVPALPPEFEVSGGASGKNIKWSRVNNRYGKPIKKAEALCNAAEELRSLVVFSKNLGIDHVVILPLAAFYGTGRLWREHKLMKQKETFIGDRMAGYTDCLSSSSSFKGVVAWYENKWNQLHDPIFPITKNIALLLAVQEAVKVVLEPTEWSKLDWDFEQKSLVVEHRSFGRLPLSSLSDGVRNMIALVADIAHRCALLNPHLTSDAARLTPGILLIDEIDMHLHPGWQQQIVELLRKTFPALQIILTTHSPHVLSTVDKESIRIIRLQAGKAVIETPIVQTRGVESADVLASIMRVDPVPQVQEAKLLSQYRALIEDGFADDVEAKLLRLHLNSHFGESHPLILDCDRLIRFQSFKIKKTQSSEGGLGDAET